MVSFSNSYATLDDYNIEIIAQNLSVPWEIDFAKDGRIFFTERDTGKLYVILPESSESLSIFNLQKDTSSILGLVLDPLFEENHYLYLFYSPDDYLDGLYRVDRFVESENIIKLDKTLLDNIPSGIGHYGGRIKFGPDDMLYITTGEPFHIQNRSQDINSVVGKIHRMTRDGVIPADNPFNSTVYSMGHRNPHGIDWDPQSGKMVITEHGPSASKYFGLDEINVIVPGGNYGWAELMGDGNNPDFINPLYHSGNTTWAPDGSVFYDSTLIPEFENKYLVATLKGSHLRVMDFDLEEEKVLSDEILFNGTFGRLRTVATDSNGAVYLLTSNTDGRGTPAENDDKIIRITPTSEINVTKNDKRILLSPLKQFLAGIDPHEVKCKEKFELIFKNSNFRPACVKSSTVEKLIYRGWDSGHDPQHTE